MDSSGAKEAANRKECAFEAILKKYNLGGDAALALLGKIVRCA
ncbi:MAG TPA: chromate resistance protein ChrB domain-containing protein [Blastocatellia bacterium]|nr:chromate resistance protein ChrB domain-containing protein [Blastocatellia bacterium]